MDGSGANVRVGPEAVLPSASTSQRQEPSPTLDLFLFIALLVTAIGLIASILMQSRGSGLGATFGGGDTSSFRTRRGVEQRLYQFTIALAVLFVIVSMLIYIAE